MESRAEAIRGASMAAPIVPAVAAYGLVFGAQATQKGLTPWEVPLLTGTNFAGGSEFAAVNLWAAPPPILLITALTWLINSRHIIMGAALTPHIERYRRWKIWIVLFFVSDESWAISHNDTAVRQKAGIENPFSLAFYFGVSIPIYAAWILSTAAGAIVGPFLGDIDRYGFDMAFPAVLIFIVASMWKGGVDAKPWAVSLAFAAAIHLTTPGYWYIAGGTLAGLASSYMFARP